MPARTARRLVISPCPPVLLPGATGRDSVPEVERIRAVAQEAVNWLLEPGDPVLVLAAGTRGHVRSGTTLSAAAYGLSYRGQLGSGPEAGGDLTPRTPGLLVAGYLLEQHPAEAIEITDVTAALDCADGIDAAAVLVCGGGSARRRDGAPGYLDPRAVPYDDTLVDRIRMADLATLWAADLPLADELLCDLAGPLAVAAQLASGWMQPLHAQVDSYCAPFGVANIVARWWTDA